MQICPVGNTAWSQFGFTNLFLHFLLQDVVPILTFHTTKHIIRHYKASWSMIQLPVRLDAIITQCLQDSRIIIPTLSKTQSHNYNLYSNNDILWEDLHMLSSKWSIEMLERNQHIYSISQTFLVQRWMFISVHGKNPAPVRMPILAHMSSKSVTPSRQLHGEVWLSLPAWHWLIGNGHLHPSWHNTWVNALQRTRYTDTLDLIPNS